MEQADLALLTAVEATRFEQSPETYGAVLTLLARQPDVVTRIRTPNRFFIVAADREGRRSTSARTHRCCAPWTRPPVEERWRRDDLAGMPGGLAVSPDGRTVAAVLLVEEGDRIVLLDAATGATIRTVTLAEVSRTTGGTAPYLWAGAGYTDAGRLLIATDDGVVRLSRGGRLLGSVPWPRRVFDDGSFLVWPDGRVSVGGLGGPQDPTGNPAGSSAVVIDTERPRLRHHAKSPAGACRGPPGRRSVAVTRTTPSGAELAAHGHGEVRAGVQRLARATPRPRSCASRRMVASCWSAPASMSSSATAPRVRRSGISAATTVGSRRASSPESTLTCCGPPGATGPRWPST